MNPPAVIRVTADHIAHGKPANAFACAIALAAREQVPGIADHAFAVAVASCITIEIGGEGEWIRAWMGDDVINIRDALDEGRRVEPFEFAVEWVAG